MAGDMILDNIEEFLFDEDRVVSYKWLSRTLSLHVNQAKSKLAEFAENWREKKESNPITLTFFISGTQETKSGNELNKVAIVKEEDLENVKKSLKKTLCEHIYSIQKSTLKDTAALYQTDFDITKQNLSECNKYSAITCKAAKAGPSASSSVIQTSSVPNGQGSHHNESKKDKSPPKVGSSSNDKRKKPGLAAFMTKSKTEAKSKVKSEVNEIPKETAAKKTNKEPKKGSLMHAFHSSQKIAKLPADQEKNKEKNNDLSKSSKESIDEAKSEKNEQTKSVKTTERETCSSEGEEETSQPMKVTPVKKQTTKTTEKKEKQNVESKKAKKRGITKIEPDSIKENGSKRRRVIRMEESSSSEDEESDVDMLEQDEEEMDDTPIPPTPEPRSTQGERNQSSQSQETCGNKRKKVWKKKKYVDNEGCMVTEKVFEYESGEGSETEEQAQPSKEENSPSGGKKETSLNSTSSSPSTDKGSKKGSPPSSGRKQTALTSFFKKM